MKRVSIIFLALLILSTWSFGAMTLDQILQQNYKSRGGLAKLKAVKTYTMTGTVNLAQPEMEFSFVMYQKRPNLMRMEADLMGQQMVQAFDGVKAWWIAPPLGITEPQEMPEGQSEEIVEQADSFDPLLDYKEKGYKLELVGTEDLEGSQVYKLKLTKTSERVTFFYLDTDSCIELKTSATINQGGSDVTVDTIFGDYKEVDGIMIPFSIDAVVAGSIGTTITVESVKINEKIDDSIFKMPEKK